MMLNPLESFWQWYQNKLREWQQDVMQTFDPEDFPPASKQATPPQSWCVTMPGKHRPYILLDGKLTEADALDALEEIAENFAQAGWTLDWKSESCCYVSKPYPEGVLISWIDVCPVEGV